MRNDDTALESVEHRGCCNRLVLEAENERLRAENGRLNAQIQDELIERKQMVEKIVALRAENGRLNAAGQDTRRTRQEIEAEIKSLESTAKDYDTDRQSNDTCVATGAHDALRWVLGLAEAPISENFCKAEGRQG